jgi:hypothetical protein
VLRGLRSRNVAEADTEAVVAVSMEAAEEVASTAVVEAADSMEAVEAGIAEAADRTEATAVDRQAQAEARVRTDAAPAGMRREGTAADGPMAHMAERVRMAHTAAVRAAIRRMRVTAARDRVRGVRIR